MQIISRKEVYHMKRLVLIILSILAVGVFSENVMAAEQPENLYLKEKELIEEYLNNGNDSWVESYDIDELYPYEEPFLIINNYLDNKEIDECFASRTHWCLPYTMADGYFGVLMFDIYDDGTVERGTSIIRSDTYYDMKVRDGKYEGIEVENVEQEFYFDVYIYGFKCCYVKMKDGKQYMIPYITDNVSSWNTIENKKIYDYDEFFEIMYRYYDEPSLDEIMSSTTNDDTIYGDGFIRETPLEKGVLSGKVNANNANKNHHEGSEFQVKSAVICGAGIMLILSVLIVYNIKKKRILK